MPVYLEKYNPGHKEKGSGYSYFVPSFINDEWRWTQPELNSLLEQAAIKLGELNSYAHLVPNIDLFIQLHVAKEAVVSSRIEGTRTNINEALLPENEINPERRNDWKEVNNYIRALNNAINELDRLPLSSRLFRMAHKILLDSVRGEYKMPGEFRTSQNWIGGATLADAVFVPPHHQYVSRLMSDLDNFLHNDDVSVPALIRIGIAHYQFETIHPFLDGNGRIGRLLITLFLVEQQILDQPLLYLSSYFEKNKALYYDNLMLVREKHNMIQWLKYFLAGIAQTASQAVATLSEIMVLKTNKEKMLQRNFGRRSHSALTLLNTLFQNPIINTEAAMKATGLSKKAVYDLINAMMKENILKEVTGQSRNRVFVFDEYLNLFQE